MRAGGADSKHGECGHAEVSNICHDPGPGPGPAVCPTSDSGSAVRPIPGSGPAGRVLVFSYCDTAGTKSLIRSLFV